MKTEESTAAGELEKEIRTFNGSKPAPANKTQMTRKQEIIGSLKAEGKTIRVNQPDFIATDWTLDPARGLFYCTCYSLEEGRWEGFVSITK